jgi:CDP-diacylglycerol--glycerol-3-phosphate 3-phosphatidyltransferase
MASIYDWKPRFQASLRPLTARLAAGGVTPNQVTVLAAVLSVATGVMLGCFARYRFVLLAMPLVLYVRMALNAIDGMLAREHAMKSRLGTILNELGDVVSDSALFLPLALVPGFSPWVVILIVILAITSEMAGVVAIQIGSSRRYDGPMGKSDRAFVLGFLCLLVGLGLNLGIWTDVALAAVAILLVITIVNRCRRALGESKPV